MQKNLVNSEKSSTFASAFKKQKRLVPHRGTRAAAQWCNGSTTDSGSVCLGSSPG